MPQADSPVTGFRPFFNPATGERITFTALAEDSDGQLVRFTWRSVPGGVITEHIHPHQEERFTILAGEAHFTLNGGSSWPERARRSSSRRASRTPRETPDQARSTASSSSARPCTPRSGTRPSPAWSPTARPRPGRAEEPAPARRHLLALPPRKPGHLTAHLGAEPHAPAPVGTGEGLRRTPLLRPLGQPDPRNRLKPSGIHPEEH